MRDDNCSRRSALKVLGAIPFLTSTAGMALTACSKKTEPDSCTDVGSLNDAEKMARSALQYTDSSPQPDKHCKICNLFQAPSDPAQCGTCQVVKGPIHPKGYCTAFVAKAG